jgi:hypothetical protein
MRLFGQFQKRSSRKLGFCVHILGTSLGGRAGERAGAWMPRPSLFGVAFAVTERYA